MGLLREALAIDANIMLRGVLGIRVPYLIDRYEPRVRFYASSEAVDEVLKNLPAMEVRRAENLETFQTAFIRLLRAITIIPSGKYSSYEQQALDRISNRDKSDWHTVALAMALGTPIWTEDKDFFGCGIATWTSATVEIYLKSSEQLQFKSI